MELGIAEEKLALTYVKALRLNQAHMVLTYYVSPGAELLILDNLNASILPASSDPDLAAGVQPQWIRPVAGQTARQGQADRQQRAAATVA